MTFNNQWFIDNDGADCGCLPVIPCGPRLRRRFSYACRLVDITPANPQVYFAVAGSPQSDSHQLTFSHTRGYMELRRKGLDHVLIATYNIWRRDAYGSIGFYLDDTFFNQPPGYFIGDIFLDCEYCFSVQLRLPVCRAVVIDCYTVPVLETCGEGICTVMDALGIGMIGGGECPLPPAVTECGTLPPYFELFDPINNTPAPCPTDTACAIPPNCTGSTPIGG